MVFKMLVLQPTFTTIDFKQENNEYKNSAWKPKRVYTSKLVPLHNLYLSQNNLTIKQALKLIILLLLQEKTITKSKLYIAY